MIIKVIYQETLLFEQFVEIMHSIFNIQMRPHYLTIDFTEGDGIDCILRNTNAAHRHRWIVSQLHTSLLKYGPAAHSKQPRSVAWAPKDDLIIVH